MKPMKNENHFSPAQEIRALVDGCPSCSAGEFSACDIPDETRAKVLALIAVTA
jgi:hypothetical protein